MPSTDKSNIKDQARKFLAEFARHGGHREAERQMGISRRTLGRRVQRCAELLGQKTFNAILAKGKQAASKDLPKKGPRLAGGVTKQRPAKVSATELDTQKTTSLIKAIVSDDKAAIRVKMLEDEVKSLREQLKDVIAQALDDTKVREHIFGLSCASYSPPAWLEGLYDDTGTAPGVPTLLASDWHWGEVVNPSEINGVNEFSLEIAHARVNTLIEKTIHTLTKEMVNPNYPGIVFALAGDLVSGNIHDELCETNDLPIMPVVLDLINHLISAIERLKEAFGKVFVPCVSGNHGRSTKKIRAKQFNFNSYDWLTYQSLARHFKDDPDVTFWIPDGTDALVSIAGHKYLFTHGNQFRGGDGVIGPLGPIIRGDHKKRSRNGQVDQSYDTLVIGHFHQLIQMRRVIVNGSVVGYNEYASANNFGYEPPQQALWITHPKNGITFSMPVVVDVDHGKLGRNSENSPWVSWHDSSAAEAPDLLKASRASKPITQEA